MKKQTKAAIEAHVMRGASYLLLFVAGTVMAFFSPQAPTNPLPRTLSFTDRVAYEWAIEDIYWRHRIWPKANAGAKPPLEKVMSRAQIEKKVEDYLRDSQALQDYWQRPITAEDLQAEMDRMARDTKRPEVLRELFDALGNDPFVIAECLARPVLSERLITSFAQEQREGRLALSEAGANSQTRKIILAHAKYALPTISDATTGCSPDTWAATSITNAPAARWLHTAVWTGSEMIVWGGYSDHDLKTGGRYNPSTDSWTVTSTANAPNGRKFHTAVWTGSEMIVWGGITGGGTPNSGGRYNPSTDSWTATSITSAPSARNSHTAVWTGSEMIVWGGVYDGRVSNTGGRYNPSTDSWVATNITNAAGARSNHTAVWTDSEMIVWGGNDGTFNGVNTGGRYNPGTDSWAATSTANAPTGRFFHTAVWTANEMIIWGGFNRANIGLNTGGRYNPSTDSWVATNITDAAGARSNHTAVWTGSEMIVWGGVSDNIGLNTGGRYNPCTDSWTATSTTNAPATREGHTAVWNEFDREMIVWGGFNGTNEFNNGGRYCAQSGSPTPTPTPTPGPIQLRGQGKKVGGINTSRLKWRGATSANVDVYRDGVVIATTPNDGLYDDTTGTTGQASFTYQVCEAGTSICSNEVTVNFSP
ncbi:MAG TPA: hypothetical protein VGM65_03335 [Candidatus Udaeobacter sp.]|jgi:N-acetylneuraminic acid mutarotase